MTVRSESDHRGRHALSGLPSRGSGAGQVLALIRSGEARTTRELADALGCSRSTVNDRLDWLLTQGLLLPAVDDRKRRGRPSTAYDFNSGAGYVLVAHFGISRSRVAVTDLNGDPVGERVEDFSFVDPPESVLERLESTFDELLADVGGERVRLYGIGIGIPSATDLPGGGPAGPREGWNGPQIVDRLSNRFDVPVLVENDVNLLALGEYRESWSGVQTFLCVKVGTGVGCGVVIGGSLYRGTQGLAGGIGHSRASEDSFVTCRCGNSGCLTAVAGGRALAARLRAQGLDAVDAQDVARLARQEVPEAALAVRQAGREVGKVLADAVNLLNPDVIAIWGYLADTQDHLFAGIRETVYQRSPPEATKSLRLVRCSLGNEAGVKGAAVMVIEHVLGSEAMDTSAREG